MQILYVSGIELQGTMPAIFPTRLMYLALPGNNIHGTLPQAYPKTLASFNVANNKLTGDIPSQLFFLPNIISM
jgi:hypothetical protein